MDYWKSQIKEKKYVEEYGLRFILNTFLALANIHAK